MGGHGALTLYLSSVLKNKQYRSASAFAPISNSTKAPWGEKAFKGFALSYFALVESSRKFTAYL